jgi:spermidine synthase
MDVRIPRYPPLPWVLILIGFTAVIAQIVLMRELVVVFRGNEISFGVTLACWLLWTAVGSAVLGRLVGRVREPRRSVALLQVILAVAFPSTILAVRAAGIVFGATPGEILGPGPMFLTSFAALSVFCVVSGALFAAGSRLHAETRGSSASEATSSVYLLEAIGSGLGGVLATLVLIRHLTSTDIALVLSALNLASAVLVSTRFPASRKTAAAIAALGACLIVAVPFGGRALESVSLRYLWRGFDLVESRNSVYGNIAVVATGDTESIYENGVVVTTIPEPAAAEEAVHFALLQHPSPRRLLLVGGGIGGALAEALKHPSLEHVDYVEMDPEILRLGTERFAEAWLPIISDPRVDIHQIDGRLFVQRAPHFYYDAIIINLPDPQTAQLNRFYTADFFNAVKFRLLPNGVYSFHVTGAENYISDQLAEFLRCVNKTLRSVFSGVIVIPGSTIHFIAAIEPVLLVADADKLVERLHSRGIDTKYVSEHYIPFRMMPDRMDDLLAQIEPTSRTPLNLDFAPIAYYYNSVLWSTRFHPSYRRLLHRVGSFRFLHVIIAVALVLAAGVAVSVWRLRRVRRLRAAALGSVAAMGMTMIGLQVLLLLAFQALYGFVYHQLAILIAAFMVGMAFGSRLATRRYREPVTVRRVVRTLLVLQIVAAVFSPLLVVLAFVSSLFDNPIGVIIIVNVVFPLLALLSGGLGGYQFPLASRIYFGGTQSGTRADTGRGAGLGAVYAIDLAGACVGAALVSAYFIPVFGFLFTALLMSVFNVAPAVVLASSLRAAQN